MSTRLLLTPTEAAEALGIGRSKLYELMRAGHVESVLIGAARRIPKDALERYVADLRGQFAL
jgi:excisionase family DNA binding protein